MPDHIAAHEGDPVGIAFRSGTEDERPHFMILHEAWEIYLDKNPIRGDMWRRYPPSDKLRELRERVDRMQSALAVMDRSDQRDQFPKSLERAEQAAIQDALDTINYAVFFVRQIREGARG